MKDENISRSRALCLKVEYETLKVLSENGGEMRGKEVIDAVEKRLDFDDWALVVYASNGLPRWKTFLHFYSVDLVKAGFLAKKKGIWFITPEGEEAMKLGPTSLFEAANRGYREWKKQSVISKPAFQDEIVEIPGDEQEREREIALDEIEAKALEGITKAINAKTPYEFQDLAAALLRGMGYFTPFIAPRGKDGGVDIMAYRDPLGTQAPRIKIQIKHRESTTPVPDVRQLMGLLQKDGDVGIFFSTGGFTPDAKTTARGSHVHVELIDLDRFIDLWRQFYDKLVDADKALLPLTSIYFIAPPA